MKCPYCGSASTGPSDRCRTCGRAIPGAAVATTTLATPLPGVSGGDGPATANPQGPLAPGQEFGARYRILKLLGAGGMGVVYQAWDQTLDIPVALKVIRPEVLSDKVAGEEVERRFKRELLLARQVTHRNVVRIHDLGEIQGTKYISMPFLEGRDLAAVLADAGRLPVTATLDIVKQIGEGLDAAHAAGVVHRDLKPENVMIDPEGRPVIMDFGVSRAVGGDTTLALTTVGSVIGTIEYMAPEQALGQAIDQRVDIYALGLIAYDLLAGRQRFASATTPLNEMMQRMQQAPTALRTNAPEIPAEVERIVARALDPDPEKRYQHVRELIDDIEAFQRGGEFVTAPRARLPLAALAAAALALALTVGGATWWVLRGVAPAAVSQPQPISVLIADFDNRTSDAVFEGSVEQALGIGLEGASFLTAYPRRDAMRAAAQIASDGSRLNEQVAQLVARREGVKVVLAGFIERNGAGYRIAVRAIDPADNSREIAAQQVEAGSKSEVLQAVGTIAVRLRKALGDTSAESNDLAQRETFTAGSLEAAREYSLGQELSNANRDEEAIHHYRRAIALDPNFGRAFSGLASVEARLGQSENAEQHFLKATSLAEKMTEREKLRTLGAFFVQMKGDYDQAIQTYSDLVRQYPGDGAAHNNLAVAYFNTGNFQKAREEGARVIDVFPRSVLYRYNHALYAMYAGDFDTAEREARIALELNPNTPKAYLAIAMASLARGKTAAAQQAYETARGIGARGASLASIGLADIAMYEGRHEDAVRILQAGVAADLASRSLAAAAPKQLAMADAQLALGRKPEALALVTAALKAPHAPSVLVPAAEILMALGLDAEASRLGQELSARLSRQDQAAGQVIHARLATARGRARDAVAALRATRETADLWLVRFALGAAYVEAGEFAGALVELDQCARRAGELCALFLDDVPTFRYRVPLLYWTARAQAGLNQPSAAKTLADFLARRPPAAADAITIDARRRLGAR